MLDNDRKKITINDLRQEVADWRKQKPENENIFTFLKTPADAAGSLIFFIILILTILFVPLIELLRLLILRPALTFFHTTVVIIAAVFLRITARPLIRLGNRAILNKEQGVNKFIYKNFPRLLRFFVLCFGPSLKYYLKIDTKDVRSIGKFQEWIDDTVGVEGIWIESDVNRAVRRETWCPFVGREIPYAPLAVQENLRPDSKSAGQGDCTEFCSNFMAGWVNDFLQYCNPEFEIAPVKYMIPKGDAFCEFVWKRKTAWRGGER
ncbi:MAG: hypothetical protein HF978_16830 [Desulfobacteraceae bacterium]|nr:hypothetical protein [Desulfobacteraceae bacterium]MBC2757209.1 hypothetical protein [Desulfobacteraceae bacterium]